MFQGGPLPGPSKSEQRLRGTAGSSEIIPPNSKPEFLPAKGDQSPCQAPEERLSLLASVWAGAGGAWRDSPFPEGRESPKPCTGGTGSWGEGVEDPLLRGSLVSVSQLARGWRRIKALRPSPVGLALRLPSGEGPGPLTVSAFPPTPSWTQGRAELWVPGRPLTSLCLILTRSAKWARRTRNSPTSSQFLPCLWFGFVSRAGAWGGLEGEGRLQGQEQGLETSTQPVLWRAPPSTSPARSSLGVFAQLGPCQEPPLPQSPAW